MWVWGGADVGAPGVESSTIWARQVCMGRGHRGSTLAVSGPEAACMGGPTPCAAMLLLATRALKLPGFHMPPHRSLLSLSFWHSLISD